VPCAVQISYHTRVVDCELRKKQTAAAVTHHEEETCLLSAHESQQIQLERALNCTAAEVMSSSGQLAQQNEAAAQERVTAMNERMTQRAKQIEEDSQALCERLQQQLAKAQNSKSLRGGSSVVGAAVTFFVSSTVTPSLSRRSALHGRLNFAVSIVFVSAVRLCPCAQMSGRRRR
jgi:hypothetical protein